VLLLRTDRRAAQADDGTLTREEVSLPLPTFTLANEACTLTNEAKSLSFSAKSLRRE
jgi:hypothetical protein